LACYEKFVELIIERDLVSKERETGWKKKTRRLSEKRP